MAENSNDALWLAGRRIRRICRRQSIHRRVSIIFNQSFAMVLCTFSNTNKSICVSSKIAEMEASVKGIEKIQP